jgi:hypothetical protein
VPHHVGDCIKVRQTGNLVHIAQCNHAIRTKPFGLCPLTGAYACNHMSAVLFGNVDSGSTDTTDRVRNENDRPGSWLNAPFDDLGSGQQDKR